MVVQEVDRLHLWRKASDQTETLRTERVGANAGDGSYFAAIGKTVTGRERHVLVAVHADGKPRVERGGEPPIPTGGLSELYHLPFGVMVQPRRTPRRSCCSNARSLPCGYQDGVVEAGANPSISGPGDVCSGLCPYQVIWAWVPSASRRRV